MLQSGGLAARPEGSTSESVTCGGSETTRAHEAAAIANAIVVIAIRTSNEVSTDGRRGQERCACPRCSLWAIISIKSRSARAGKLRRMRRRLTMAKTGKPTRPMLGAHMSIAGEVGEALNRGKQVGCDCIQIFTKSSRQWASKPLLKEEIEKFKHNRIETGITTVIAHDSYLVNLGAPDHAMRAKSVKGFIDELHRCEALGVPILVTHPGAHVGSGIENGIQTIAKSIDEAHAASKGFEVKIALESTARQGTHIRRKVERVARIF